MFTTMVPLFNVVVIFADCASTPHALVNMSINNTSNKREKLPRRDPTPVKIREIYCFQKHIKSRPFFLPVNRNPSTVTLERSALEFDIDGVDETKLLKKD